MDKQQKCINESFIDGMSSFDIMPSFNFELKELSVSSVFSEVANSFSKTGRVMYLALQNEGEKINGSKASHR